MKKVVFKVLSVTLKCVAVLCHGVSAIAELCCEGFTKLSAKCDEQVDKASS